MSFALQKQWIRLRRMIKNGGHNLMRNKVLAIATLLIISLMFFVFNIILALSFATDSVISSVGEKVDISVEMLPDVEPYAIQTFADTLKNNPDVATADIITKEDALKRFGQKYPNVISFLSSHGIDNPLPNTVRVVTRDVAYNNDILNTLAGPAYSHLINQEKLAANEEQKTRNEKILEITRFLRSVGLWLNILVAIVATLIIFNSISINIHAHKHEIRIMQLVGAKHAFIRGGYLFEGLIYAVLALVVSVSVSQGVLSVLANKLLAVITNESLLAGLNAVLFHFRDQFSTTLLWQLLIALAVGTVSSLLAIELYLRRNQAGT